MKIIIQPFIVFCGCSLTIRDANVPAYRLSCSLSRISAECPVEDRPVA